MHEGQILDIIDSVTLDKLTLEEKAIILADVQNEISNKRFAGNAFNIVLAKVNDLANGMYKEALKAPDSFQDFTEKGEIGQPFQIQNKDEIDQFLDKMMSDDFNPDYFNDTWDFYHPTDVMKSEGLPRHRSDFVVK